MDYRNFDPEHCYNSVTEELWQYVYARDNGICQVKGGQGEVVHHIKYRSKGVEHKANNLILLSDKEHKKEHNKRHLDPNYYLERVKRNEKRFRERLV